MNDNKKDLVAKKTGIGELLKRKGVFRSDIVNLSKKKKRRGGKYEADVEEVVLNETLYRYEE